MARIRSNVVNNIMIWLSALAYGAAASAAIDVSSDVTQDHYHYRIADIGQPSLDLDWARHSRRSIQAFSNNANIANPNVTRLTSNVPATFNLNPGQTIFFVFDGSNITKSNITDEISRRLSSSFGVVKKQHILRNRNNTQQSQAETELDKRQNVRERVYISANTCLQPETGNRSPGPHLSMFVSADMERPGPDQAGTDQIRLVQGHGKATRPAGRDIYIAVSAPNNTVTSGTWNFAVAASFDDFYFDAIDRPSAYLVDTDYDASLLVTESLVDAARLEADSSLRDYWANHPPPFNLLVIPKSKNIEGIRQSFCGLSLLRVPNAQINSTIVMRNDGATPKQQFLVSNLFDETSYWAVLVMKGVDVPITTYAAVPGLARGGGQVWKAFEFATNEDENCKLIYGLSFCSDVAYAVPANSTSNMTTLVQFYDGNAERMYKNFSLSLQQIACNASANARYSLSRGCDDCARDYKNWLCAVTIPRCLDFRPIAIPPLSSGKKDQFIQPRNLGATHYINGSAVDLSAVGLSEANRSLIWQNASRFPAIDEEINPGPYNELLPCINLCHELVKSCPASMKFNCPDDRDFILSYYANMGAEEYGKKPGVLPCNWVGKDQNAVAISAAAIVTTASNVIFGVLGLGWFLGLF